MLPNSCALFRTNSATWRNVAGISQGKWYVSLLKIDILFGFSGDTIHFPALSARPLLHLAEFIRSRGAAVGLTENGRFLISGEKFKNTYTELFLKVPESP